MYELLRKIILFWIGSFGSQRQKEFLKNRIGQNFTSLHSGIRHWIHASSVGEVNLLDSFLRECLERFEGDILLSVFTDTGQEAAIKKYEKEKRVHICYFPLDNAKEIEKILEKIQLKTLFLVETELWPNLITVASRKAKIVLINGRISERSFGRYQKIRFLLQPLLEKISHFYVQTEEDKTRFLSLGARESSCEVVGNLKFDIQVETFSQEEKEKFKQMLTLKNKKIWVAGSTRTGEYEILIDAFMKLKSNTVLILVPRHLERIPAIQKYLKERNLSYRSYTDFNEVISKDIVLEEANFGKIDLENMPLNGVLSKNIAFDEEDSGKIVLDERDFQVLLVDTMGVLRKFYSIADYTFVGGSLVNIGGHSLLEPLCYYKTPIFGPYTQNVKEIAKEIQKRNLGYQVQNAEELYEAIQQIEKRTPKVDQEIEYFLEANRQVGSKILESEES